MENEIMNNEVTENVVEVIEPERAGKGLIAAAVIGISIFAGRAIYKKFVKPAVAKAKAKKENEAIEADYEEPTVEVIDSEEN